MLSGLAALAAVTTLPAALLLRRRPERATGPVPGGWSFDVMRSHGAPPHQLRAGARGLRDRHDFLAVSKAGQPHAA
ncbi:hypothetical protein FHG71_18705 [Rubellimicrobium roseum]|uniref:Uncharacterized protein n=2 Tax=Rubellimicrobium roseum TaxID=687525 RepID=A0A5C4N7J6_9RHOB|nr:hypothetical protein FHG71_18705 [Rubellimicrobium roseum]